MHARGTSLCDVCGDEIPARVPYRIALLTAAAAAGLLDTTEPRLVPTWTQDADLTVRMDLCLWCAREPGLPCDVVTQ